MIGQLEDWLAANPPLLGINWASMLEIGLRARSRGPGPCISCSADDGRRPIPPGSSTCSSLSTGSSPRRAEPVDLLQSQHASDRRSARPLRCWRRAARTRGKLALDGTPGRTHPHRRNRPTDSRRRRPCRTVHALSALHARLLPDGAAHRRSADLDATAGGDLSRRRDAARGIHTSNGGRSRTAADDW